ncbi:flagellar hook-length control protein FliK [Colwellia sp. Bg11-12]|uniref:flagellar hook-length control protein FliK n=1 Tax=Colwellia sp. Bg11-12 TaxID=2759817 RepID=UPI0015F650A1|nr:flagellar hook-length control protein FliK [Colwellia sp. Bg11-12]MBA6264360.1 flagellar hook-length control protein FliK [Colwellia sp. Bg11-12]
MPQVNTLAIDIAPSKDFSSVQSGATGSSKNSNKDFAQMVDQHYQNQQSGKKQETSGNKTKVDAESNPVNKSAPSKDKELGTVSDEEINTEIDESESAEKLPSDDQDINERKDQLENAQKEEPEQKSAIVVNVNNESPTSKNTESSTEQLMSFLSASQKILSDGVKGENTVTPINNEKLSTLESAGKQQEKTELEVLLKQVLGGNDKVKTETIEDNSVKSNTDKNVAEQLKVQVASKSAALINKTDAQSLPIVEAVKSESKLDVAVVEKKAGNEQVSPMKLTDLKTPLSTQTETSLKTETAVNNATKQQMSASDLETLAVGEENTATEDELEKNKTAFLGSQDKATTHDKTPQSQAQNNTSVTKEGAETALPVTVKNENLVGEIDANNINTDKVAFAGVSVPGEKQAQESNQNQSRVINQATHKVLEPQNSSAGEQSQEQSSEQQNKKMAQNFTNAEKLVNNEVPVKEKPFSDIFDKKQMNTSIDNALNRDILQVNEATKSAAFTEEMITKLSSENVQSTAQSVTNAKQATSLQNEALSVYRKDFAGALKDKVMVMMNQKLQQIEIRLDPQELGNVNVKINMQNEQAVVNFTVQNQQAKEAFDQNLGRLKEMLAESGVDVGDANVEQQSKQNNEDELGGGGQGGEGDVTGNELSELSDTQTLNLVKGSSTGVDYYA